MRVPTRIFLPATLLALVSACTVDSNYSADKLQDINTEVTIFENGLAVPVIKSTTSIKVGDLIKEISDPDIRDIFKLTEDGKYEVRYNGYLNLDQKIKDIDLEGIAKISPVNIESDFSFEFGELDPDKFKSEETKFGEDTTLPDFSDALNFNVGSLNESIKVDAGIGNIDYNLNINIDPIESNQVMFTKTTLNTAGALAPTETVSLPNSEVTLAVEPKAVAAFSIPSSIKEIDSVTLKSNARLSVSLSISNNIFTGGTITPDVQVDLSDLLVFEGGSGILDLSSMTPMSAANNFCSTKEFAISGVNAAKLAASKSVSTTGSVSISGATAGKTQCMNAQGDLGVNISISFLDFEVASVGCKIKDISTSVSKDFEVKINEVTLPSQVKSVDFITFSEDSKITIVLSAANLNKLPGISMNASTVSVTFPSEFVISGENVSNNVLSLSDVNLKTGKTAVVKLSKLNLPAAQNGKINFAKKIGVSAQCTTTGSINTSELKELGSEDVSVSAKVQSSLNVADFQATTAEFKTTVPQTKGNISFDVPEKAASFGTFTITPEGTPSISVKMTVPDLGGKTVSAGNGVKIQIPSFLVLGTITDSDLNYDKTSNTLTIKQIKDKTFSIPVDRIVAKAEKVGNAWKIKGSYEVSGEISVPEGPVSKSVLKKISGAKFGFKATVPSIKASKIAVDSLSFDVNETVNFDVLKSKDIPDMIAGIGEVVLNDVKANLGLELKGMPSIGNNGKFIVDIKATLPSFLKPSAFNISGEIKNGKFTNSPVSIDGFDFSEFDFAQMKSKGESLKGSVKIAGRIYAENPEIDLSTVSGKVEGKLKASISGPNNKISLKSLSARLDYQLDSTITVSLGDFSKYLGNVHFDIPDISAIIGIRSNLAIPVSASAKVFPLKNNQEDQSKAVSADLKFPYSPNPAQSDSVTNNLKLNVNEILNSKCDSLRINFAVRSDKTKNCYLEPAAEYRLGAGYDVSIPLQLNEGFSLEVCDTLDLEGGLSGIQDILAKSEFGIIGEIESTLPIGAHVILEFLSYDKVGKVYRTLPLKSVETDLLEPNKTSAFEILTGPKTPGAKIDEITHLRVCIVLSSDGNKIGPDSHIKINNLSVVVPKGITIDPANI